MCASAVDANVRQTSIIAPAFCLASQYLVALRPRRKTSRNDNAMRRSASAASTRFSHAVHLRVPCDVLTSAATTDTSSTQASGCRMWCAARPR